MFHKSYIFRIFAKAKVTKIFIFTMDSRTKLNFPPIKLNACEEHGRTMVYDKVRNTYIVLTPEEWVRRHLVEYLISYCGAPLRSIVEEYPVNLNSMAQRADVVVMDSNAAPLMLAECKAPNINFKSKTILQEVFLQLTRYNAIIKARYICITNGLLHYCWEYTPDGYKPLNGFPRLDL